MADVEDPGGAVHVRILTAPDPAELRSWDQLVQRTPGTDVTQLAAWGRLRRLVGFAPMQVLAERDGRIVGGGQILVRRLPLIGFVGYVAYGPLVAPGDPDAEAVQRSLVAALTGIGRQQLQMLFVQPPEGAEETSAQLRERGFRPSTAGIAPIGSVRIDLTEDLDTIRCRFGRRLRSWPNRWAARGVVVRRGDECDLPLLSELMAHSAAAQGHPRSPPAYVNALFRELAPGGHAALFIGEVNGVPLAADLVTRCGELVRGRLSGFDRTGDAAKVSLPAAVRWHILQWAKAEGCHWLDFGGLSAPTLDVLMRGGERPKDGWPAGDQPKLTFGGTAFRYPQAVELITSPVLRAGYDVARRSAHGRRVLGAAQQLLRNGRRDPTPSPARSLR
jgi:hypothetical protein